MPTLEIVEVLCGACLTIVRIDGEGYYETCPKCGDILVDNRPSW